MMSTDFGWFKAVSLDEILSVASIEQIGPITWTKLYQKYGSLKSMLKKAVIPELSPGQQAALTNRPRNTEVLQRLLLKGKIELIVRDSPDYPKLLAEINDPPLWLFYIGDTQALQRPTVSVVGSRKVSPYGKGVIESLFDQAILQKVTTVSGLAYGVDKYIHLKSVEAFQPSVAVLAGGLDSIYPVDHFGLAQRIIKEGGLLLSEYPPLSRPKPYRFPVRNRIIAGLSPLTIIIEANLPSGSLTTAKSAIEYNRDLFAVPGDITRPTSQGTNFLIHQGATALYTNQQLYDYYRIDRKKVATTVDKELRQILDLLSENALSLDQLCVVSKRSVEVVLGLVTQLELLGMLYQPSPGIYQKK